MNACSFVVHMSRRPSLEVEPLECESDGAALWLANDVLALLVVRIQIRKIRRRDVAGRLNVHSAASLPTKISRNARLKPGFHYPS